MISVIVTGTTFSIGRDDLLCLIGEYFINDPLDTWIIILEDIEDENIWDCTKSQRSEIT